MLSAAAFVCAQRVERSAQTKPGRRWDLERESRMEDQDQTCPDRHPRLLQFTCPTCKRRVCIPQENPAQLPRFFPFCSERCKLIDLGAWLDADYRIPSKSDEEPEAPPGASSSADSADSEDE